ncbi:GNAT family N-acetyltransferase [Fulvivirga ulvae]|uniref:aminoglycoside 6'-N-acetyltransferase n=1 Tax=Fulvivirga ulvae TaxID=2904245 RepID=UPI001F418532|nr:aminoglycoside 6'-N-acetyltransferase [Fulvivirga ulvae]UII32444.1 GNAT family N-acetyltransferase [Fulvivirga ulvae]
MKTEAISKNNLEPLTQLVLKLWTECNYQEEFDNCQQILYSDDQTAFLVKDGEADYVAFIMLSVRKDYVEGTESSPVGYVEGIYVRPEYRRSGIAKGLMETGKTWCKNKDCKEMASDAELHNITSQKFHEYCGYSETNRIVCYVTKIN